MSGFRGTFVEGKGFVVQEEHDDSVYGIWLLFWRVFHGNKMPPLYLRLWKRLRYSKLFFHPIKIKV